MLSHGRLQRRARRYFGAGLLPSQLSSAPSQAFLKFSEILTSLLKSAADGGRARSELRQGSNYCRTHSGLFNGNLPPFNHSALVLLKS